jgi:hypothetical protein
MVHGLSFPGAYQPGWAISALSELNLKTMAIRTAQEVIDISYCFYVSQCRINSIDGDLSSLRDSIILRRYSISEVVTFLSLVFEPVAIPARIPSKGCHKFRIFALEKSETKSAKLP